MDKPTISVIMSIFKESIDWIKLSIGSILNQTYGDFELIIINDCPGRIENNILLNELENKDSRIKIIHNKENIGLTRSLNKGLAVAKGEYIARMDADDISDIRRFEYQILFFKDNPDCDLCSTSFVSIDENGNLLNKGKIHYRDISYIFRLNPIGHPTVMFRSTLLKMRNPLYNEELMCAQDVDLWTFFYSSGTRMHVLNKTLLQYRETTTQISKSKGTKQFQIARDCRRNLIHNYLQNKHLIVYNKTDSGLILDLKKTLSCIEKKYYTFGSEDRDNFNSILFVFYVTLAYKNPIYPIKYIFSRTLLPFKLDFVDTLHIIMQPFCRSRLQSLMY